MNKKFKSDYVIVAHKFNPQPDDELIKYLVSTGQNVVQVCHSFSDADNRKSWISKFMFHILKEKAHPVNEVLIGWAR